MAASRINAPVGGQGGDLAAVGCWGGCWVSGCWGGCWPGVQAEPDVIRAVSAALGDVEGAPRDLSRLFDSVATGASKQLSAESRPEDLAATLRQAAAIIEAASQKAGG